MGSFSWTRAEHTTERSNFTYGDNLKCLVPKEFGGGYIRFTYYDYGYVWETFREGYYEDGGGTRYPADTFPVNDLYGILAWWNLPKDRALIYEGDKYPDNTKEILLYGKTCDDTNRGRGINIGCYDDQIDRLAFPLKLVSVSYQGTYEDCPGHSYGDINQGFVKGRWTRIYRKHLDILKKAEKEALRNHDVSSTEKQDACPYHVVVDVPNTNLGATKTEAEARKILIGFARAKDTLHKLEYEHFAIDWDNDGNGFWLQLWNGPNGHQASPSRWEGVHVKRCPENRKRSRITYASAMNEKGTEK